MVIKVSGHASGKGLWGLRGIAALLSIDRVHRRKWKSLTHSNKQSHMEIIESSQDNTCRNSLSMCFVEVGVQKFNAQFEGDKLCTFH